MTERHDKPDILSGMSPESAFRLRLQSNATDMRRLFDGLYAGHPAHDAAFRRIEEALLRAHLDRPARMVARDEAKLDRGHWFLSQDITGMSLYVDRFCGSIPALSGRLDYFSELGVNLLHLMPLFESPEGESDGGYAVSDFRRVDPRFGTLDDLQALQSAMQEKDMYLMLDIVLNHTSHHHEWARKARAGDERCRAFYHMFPDRTMPDAYEAAMPEIFPESSPGNFTWIPECDRWVMTVFHHYQWDLDYRNPEVFVAMLENVLFYANLGVDILRIDAPAFIWKEPGTSCQNLPQAHALLRLLRLCVATSAPGMALLGEAIVAPRDIMEYFGTGEFTARECDIAYNATHMALQWDALATSDTRVMLAAQPELSRKPFGTTWINYVRCHDDIGLGYDDHMIREAGYDPYAHRSFLKEYYSGAFPGSVARGALFSVNPRTGDARISGSLASLCGLEAALESGLPEGIEKALGRISLMQAHSLFLGGLPMVFQGDELGSLNDYSYLSDPGKSYDNRWMHRAVTDWGKAERRQQEGTVEHRVFSDLSRLIRIRRSLGMVADHGNLSWMRSHNRQVAGYLRSLDGRMLYCVYNFGPTDAWLTWYAFKEHGHLPSTFIDHWSGKRFDCGWDHEHLIIPHYGFHLLEVTG
jgi:amylosucrase